MQWFRLYAEFATDPLVQALAFDDQRHFVMLLCLKADGVLDKPLAKQLRDSMIRRALGLDAFAAQEAKRRLQDASLIDPDWMPVNWGKRQFENDSSAERTRRWRERKNSASDGRDGHSDVTVTSPDTDTDTDTEEASLPSQRAGRESVVARRNDAQPPPDESPETASTQGDSSAHSGVPRNTCPCERIVSLYHEKLPMCRRVEQLTPNRRAALRARWHNELPTLDAFGNYFDDVAASRFLTGRTDNRGDRRPFVADFDWLLKPSNLVKVLEGKYHDG